MDFRKTMSMMDRIIEDLKMEENTDTSELEESSGSAMRVKCEIIQAFAKIMEEHDRELEAIDIIDVCDNVSSLIATFPMYVVLCHSLKRAGRRLCATATKAKGKL